MLLFTKPDTLANGNRRYQGVLGYCFYTIRYSH